MAPLPSETITYVRRRIDQLSHFVQNPNAREMLAEGTMNPVRAMVIRAVLATPGLPDFLQERSYISGYRRAGFDVLGTGYHAVTVTDGPAAVKKFYRHTAGLTESEQNGQIKVWDAKQKLALEHLGAYAVPQTFTIESNPLNSAESVVTATQERIESVGAIDIFAPEQNLDGTQSFIADSYAMQYQSGIAAVPDLFGRNNAVIEATTGAVKLIDPITLVRDDPIDENGYARVSRYLEARHARDTHRA